MEGIKIKLERHIKVMKIQMSNVKAKISKCKMNMFIVKTQLNETQL